MFVETHRLVLLTSFARSSTQSPDWWLLACTGIFVLRHSAADPIAPAALLLSGHDAAVTCFHWSAPTNTVISGSADKTIRVYTLFKVS